MGKGRLSSGLVRTLIRVDPDGDSPRAEDAATVSIAAISVVLAAASVIAASSFYSFQIRNQIRLRRTDLLVRLYSTWDTLEFQEAFHKIYWAEFHDLDSLIASIGGRPVGTYVFTFYDQVGALLKRGLIDLDLVNDLLGNSTLQMWEKVGSALIETRSRSGDQTLYVNFEFLYHETKKHSAPESPEPRSS
jgi:hypothetical protein